MICRFASRASVAHSQPPRLREGLHVCFVDLLLVRASRTIVVVSPIRVAMFLLYTGPRVVSHILVASDRVRGCTLPTRCVAHCLSQLAARSSRKCIVCYLSQVVSFGVGDCIETTPFFAAHIMVVYCIGIARNMWGCIIIQVPV